MKKINKVFLVIGKTRYCKDCYGKEYLEDRYLRTYNKSLAFKFAEKHSNSYEVIEFSKAIWIVMY